jgi:hypothetical protein
MKSLRAAWALIALLFTTPLLAQVQSSMTVIPMQGVNLADFDPKNPATVPLLFTVTVTNDNVERNLRAEVTISGEKYGDLIVVTKYLKNLRPYAVAVFNNKQFDEHKDKSKPEFREAAESTGKLPADAYSFDLVVYDEGSGEEVASSSSEVEVANIISKPELIGPGDEMDYEAEIIYQKNPLFQWYAEAATFDFAVYPVYDWQKNAEEVALNRPVFTQKNINVSNFQYPAYAEVLQEGKRYAWQVTAYTNTSKGRQPLYSNVYWFRMQSPVETDQVITSMQFNADHIETEPKKTYQFEVQAMNAEGKAVSITPTWEVIPSNMGHVDQNGLFTAGLMNGTAAVIARYSDKKEYATIYIATPKEITTPKETK